MKFRYSKILCTIAVLIGMGPQARSLPTMIRLGYTNCSTCHISPQGGGLLNAYGRGIDQAQSLRGGDYKPAEGKWLRFFTWDHRITEDVRSVTQEQIASTTGKPGTQILRSRLMYRNATDLGSGVRFSMTLTAENENVLRPTFPYDHPTKTGTLFLNTSLLSYRPKGNLEIAAGRDQLPSGINIPDLGVFVRSRNRSGYYDSLTQVKIFWWGKRYLITPYAFGPGGNEQTGERESGGGALAEVDPFGHQHTVFGMNLLRATSRSRDRTLIGPYARLGFGSWGVLAEHDITNYAAGAKFGALQQRTTYGQLFWYPKEWLLTSIGGERLGVDVPFKQELNAARFDVSARIASQATIGFTLRVQHDPLSGRTVRSLALNVALKTVT
ncbi:MAG: hypothetical protein DMG61_01520 [Acidobacteria bacterium]|nr:MAG: hypothetical protein DMG61_01520 [Acidobacteriota bacterium]